MKGCVVECPCGQRMVAPEHALGGMGTCVHCGARIRLDATNTWQPAENAATCARCGRDFQGDWDRHMTDAGELCKVCAKQYQPPRMADVQPLEPGYSITGLAQPPSERPVPVMDSPEDKQPTNPRKGLWIYIGVSAVLVVGVMLLPMDKVTTLQAVKEKRSIPLDLLIFYVYQFTTLYCALHWCNLLPNATFKKNLIVIGAVSLALTAPYLLAMLNVYLLALFMLCQILIVSYVYDMQFRDLLRYVVLCGGLGLAASNLRGFIYMALANAF